MGAVEFCAALSRHTSIGLDSCVLIYHLENHPQFGELADAAMQHIAERGMLVRLSPLLLMEVQVGPYTKKDPIVADYNYDSLVWHPRAICVSP